MPRTIKTMSWYVNLCILLPMVYIAKGQKPLKIMIILAIRGEEVVTVEQPIVPQFWSTSIGFEKRGAIVCI